MTTTEIGADIERAVSLLQQKELVAIPTETVYGLAANALEPEAIVKIFEAKQRPFFNPLILHVASIKEISKYAELNSLSEKLAQLFMPGPLTLLLPKKEIVPDIVTSGSNKVAIRVPQHTITQNLLTKINFPIAAPSANPFGYVSPVTAEHVKAGLDGKISYILDGGDCSVGIESTIIEVDEDQIILHRVGGLPIEQIEEAIGKKIMKKNPSKQPITSGQLKSHYATTTDLIHGNLEELIKQYKTKNAAIISLNKYFINIKKENQFILSAVGDLNVAAQNLFKVMRDLDNLHFDIILADIFPNEGLGVAINDRLHRAQASEKS